MAEHTALKKALRQMAEGSKSAFHTFYQGTSQYIYSSALLLYDSHEDACRFMVDFYQYLYLHLPEYDRTVNLENWISHLLLERFEQLSIGKNMPKPSVRQQMNSSAQLSKSEQERVWRMLDVNIHFPKEPVRHSARSIALLVSVLLLLLLVAIRYVPAAIERLQSSGISSNSDDISGESAGPEDAQKEGADSDEAGEDQTDELDSMKDELDDLLNERADSETDKTTDVTDSLQMQQSENASGEGRTKTPESPAEPDTPQEPDQPQEPQTPQEPDLSTGSDELSGTEDLENLELELYYGDDLRF